MLAAVHLALSLALLANALPRLFGSVDERRTIRP
jgi:hypothetical protein